MPRPPERVGAIADELLKSFDRALELRAKIAKLEDELAPLEKRLVWTLMPAAYAVGTFRRQDVSATYLGQPARAAPDQGQRSKLVPCVRRAAHQPRSGPRSPPADR